jgi:hypothetical protein
MAGNLFAGRRGDILWRRPGVGGSGQRRDYDSYAGWGYIYPVALTEPIHLFNISSHTASGIPLRPDRGFKGAAFVQEWSGLLLILSALATPVLALVAAFKQIEGEPEWLRYAVLAGVAAVVLVVTIVMFVRQRRADQPHRDIRLLLGPHAWGSSDPAYWDTKMHSAIVRPAEGFAALARQAIADKQWARAMWAARLCCAVEDFELGQKLTRDVLGQPAVRELLPRLRQDPAGRDRLLGDPIPLSTWVTVDPAKVVLEWHV